MSFQIDTAKFERVLLMATEQTNVSIAELGSTITKRKEMFDKVFSNVCRGQINTRTKLEVAYHDLHKSLVSGVKFFVHKSSQSPMTTIRLWNDKRSRYKQDNVTPCTVQSVLKSIILMRALLHDVKTQLDGDAHTNRWAAAVGISHMLDPFLVSTFEPFGTMWWISYEMGSINPVNHLRGNIRYADCAINPNRFEDLHKQLMKHPVYSHWWLPLTDQLARSTPMDKNEQLIDWDLFKQGISIRAGEAGEFVIMRQIGKDIRKGIIETKGKLL